MNTPALKPLVLAAALAAIPLSAPTLAYEAGDWIARVGAHDIKPKDHNHEVVHVESAPAVTGSVVVFLTPQVAVDLLVALPIKHDISLNSTGQDVASTRHLPPTLSLAWYPEVAESWHPFVGAGINYTTFFEEDTRGALAGTRLKLKDSWGGAVLAGVAVDLSPKWSLMVDGRYMDIDTQARLDGASLGKVHIDPVAYGVALGYRV